MTDREYIDACQLFNIPYDRGRIGQSGEGLACAVLGFFGVFRVFFLGENEPIVDLLIEIADENTPFYAMAQVKSTTLLPDRTKALTTPIKKEKYNALINRPLPTYIVGVDLNKVQLYISPVIKEVDSDVTKIQQSHVLDFNDLDHLAVELVQLRTDIIAFWHFFNLPANKPQFSSLL